MDLSFAGHVLVIEWIDYVQILLSIFFLSIVTQLLSPVAVPPVPKVVTILKSSREYPCRRIC